MLSQQRSSSCCWQQRNLREVRSAHSTVSIRVVVDHNRVAHELVLASTCMAISLTQAGAHSHQEVLSCSCGQLPSKCRQCVRRVRLMKSKGRVKRIRKIHGRSSVPLRQREARIAHASVSKVSHCGAAGLNGTQPR